MDPLGPPPDARYTGAFARQPRNGHRTAYGTFFPPARGVGQPPVSGRPSALQGLLLALLGKARAGRAAPQSRQSVGMSVKTADFSAPRTPNPVTPSPRICLGGT